MPSLKLLEKEVPQSRHILKDELTKLSGYSRINQLQYLNILTPETLCTGGTSLRIGKNRLFQFVAVPTQ